MSNAWALNPKPNFRDEPEVGGGVLRGLHFRERMYDLFAI